MRLDGRMPDLFLISSMSLHTAACRELIRDVCRIEPSQRPLVIVGGSLCIYEPWEAFRIGPDGDEAFDSSKASSVAADVAVTGEEYVLLDLLEVLLCERSDGEPLRQAFFRARDSGALDRIPGLVYPHLDGNGHVVELVDTGRQRLLADLDELAFPTIGYGILEAPSRRAELASRPLDAALVRKYSPVSSLLITLGCKFACEYCPIPAYNQRHLRGKSGPRVAEEMHAIQSLYGIRYYFGTDDNFLADTQRATEIIESLSNFERNGVRLGRKVRWGTEATVHDTLRMREYVPALHRAGMRGLWLGVEDMTGTLVRKGQSVDKTTEAFRLLRSNGICPMPMMMHHDAQPLLTRGRPDGLLNQISILRKAGAVSLQVLMLTPSAGSKLFEQTFTSGSVYQSVAGRHVQPNMYDGNFVIATRARRPWQRQLNLILAYAFFYNPLRLLADLLDHRGIVGIRPAAMQVVGMWGLFHTIRRTFGWMIRLMIGRGTRRLEPPASPWPMQSSETIRIGAAPGDQPIPSP